MHVCVCEHNVVPICQSGLESQGRWVQDPYFLLAAFVSALLAFFMSFASLWFLSTTTANTYSLIGSLNKIPVALIGLFAFSVPWTIPNLASVLIGLVAGIIFVQAKAAGK